MIKELKGFLQQEEGVLFCYLFGSQATGTSISKSDIDIGLFFDKHQVDDFFEKRLELIGEISKLLKKDTDIVVLNTASSFLKYVVLKEGKIIFERSQDKRVDFELKTLNDYFDFKPVLEKYNQRVLNY
ncbi:MAG: nucleotidyltransferase domain-containing protein [Candidatus Pacebacteria bacterium]|nr:nucleotidyltransferase domain-containing protein [Candidatus Paceibacterota bacterium]